MKNITFSFRLALVFLLISKLSVITIQLYSQATSLPLVTIDTLDYQGSFIIPSGTYGSSQTNYCAGTIEYNPANHSLFMAGKKEDGSIGEFSIPIELKDTLLSNLNVATVLQNFRNVMSITPDNNPQSIDRVSGMKLYNGKLIVNGMEFYDAPANNTHTTLVLDDPTNLSTTTATGYYELMGAAHFSGWISDIPLEWQSLLGGAYLAGNSSKYAINGRLPMGITAFVFDPALLTGTPGAKIATTTLLDFDLANPLYASFTSTYANASYNLIVVNGSTPPGHTFQDAQATVGNNDLWTEESQASYGFILPGTRTYMTVGSSGGHNSGIGYKATQNSGNICGGPCPYDSSDYYNYYWLWDVNDFLDVKNGVVQAYDVRPYDYGVFDAPLQKDAYNGYVPEHHPITGGTFDPVSSRLYLTIYGGGVTTTYGQNPAIAVYDINTIFTANNEKLSPLNFCISPNPTNDYFSIQLSRGLFKKAEIYRVNGQLLKVLTETKIDLSDFSNGIYFVKVFTTDGEMIVNKVIKE